MTARLLRTFGADLCYHLALLHLWQLALTVFWLTGAVHGS